MRVYSIGWAFIPDLLLPDPVWKAIIKVIMNLPTPTPVTGTPLNQPDFVTALARGLSVIRALGEEGPPTTLAEISRRVGLARATVRRSLITLETLGYVENDGRSFALTSKVLSLGYSYLSSIPLARASKSCLEDISAMLNESSGTAILDGDDVVLLVRVPVQRVVNPGIPSGSRLPAYCTATGHVLLAGQSDEAIDGYLSRIHPEAITPRTETDLAKIRASILATRRSGYALQSEQAEVGVRAISVPIENMHHRVVAALNVVAPVDRVSEQEMIGRFVPLMRKKAEEIRRAL
jgi:IclR family pca regulon transcriptional regulator